MNFFLKKKNVEGIGAFFVAHVFFKKTLKINDFLKIDFKQFLNFNGVFLEMN